MFTNKKLLKKLGSVAATGGIKKKKSVGLMFGKMKNGKAC